jgi:hypothetical protein
MSNIVQCYQYLKYTTAVLQVIIFNNTLIICIIIRVILGDVFFVAFSAGSTAEQGIITHWCCKGTVASTPTPPILFACFQCFALFGD